MEINKPVLQDAFLKLLCEKRVQVSIYLVNGIQLTGVIEAFDAYVVFLQSSITQAVYKHAISSIVSTRAIAVGSDDPAADMVVVKRTQFGMKPMGNSAGARRQPALYGTQSIDKDYE